MDDVANVGLVDAEAERARRNHDGAAAGLHVELLLRGPLVAGHLAVIMVRRDAERAEPGVHGVDLARRRAVDDAGPLQAVREARERP